MAYIEQGGTERFRLNRRGFWTGSVEWWEDLAGGSSALPDIGSAYGGSDPWADTLLIGIEQIKSPSGKRKILRLDYTDEPQTSNTGNPSRDVENNTPIYRMEVSDEPIPISRHPNYLARWNHDLYVRIRADGAYELLGEFDPLTATETDLTADHAEIVQWVPLGGIIDKIDSEGFRWGKYSSMMKPGVEEFPFKAPVIVETRWFSNDEDAGTFACGNQGELLAPAKTFGLSPATNGHFLVGSGDVQPDGRRWQADRRYVWSRIAFDTDLYPIP